MYVSPVNHTSRNADLPQDGVVVYGGVGPLKQALYDMWIYDYGTRRFLFHLTRMIQKRTNGESWSFPRRPRSLLISVIRRILVSSLGESQPLTSLQVI